MPSQSAASLGEWILEKYGKDSMFMLGKRVIKYDSRGSLLTHKSFVVDEGNGMSEEYGQVSRHDKYNRIERGG